MMPPAMNSPAVAIRPAPPRAVQATRIVAVLSLLALIALGLAWELWLVLPLLLPLPGLLANRMYTYRWASLFVWLYFVEGVVRASGDKPPGDLLALLQIALCLIFFSACALHVRLRQRHARSMAK